MFERSLAADADGGRISLIASPLLSCNLSLALFIVVSPTPLSVFPPLPLLSCPQKLPPRVISLMGKKPLPKW